MGDFIDLMDQWAPPWVAEDWDRVGLMVGRPADPAERAWVALEATPDLIDEALAQGVQLLLVHHPPIFKPLKDLRSDRPATAALIRAAAGGLSIFAAHTNLDAAPGGVNDALAAVLGLENTRPLVPAGEGGLAKLVAFVPLEHHAPVARALFAAGAGRIGDYRDCAFFAPGTGTFLAPPDGDPYQGSPGSREEVSEERLEVILPRAAAGRVLAALVEAHPYEEPAWDLYPLLSAPAGFGLGRVGELAAPQEGAAFLRQAARALGAPAAVAAGPLPDRVRRVAVVGGSGGDLLGAAAGAGAQVLITGEARHSAGLEARDLGLCLVAAGHFATENVIVEPWARRLEQMLAARDLYSLVTPRADLSCPWSPVYKEDGLD